MKPINQMMSFICLLLTLSGHMYGRKLSLYMSYGLAFGSKGSGLKGSNSVSTDLVPSQNHVKYPSIGVGRHMELGADVSVYQNWNVRLTGGYSVTPTLEASSSCTGFVDEKSDYTGHVWFGKCLLSYQMPVSFMHFYAGAGLGIFRAMVKRQVDCQIANQEGDSDYLLNGQYDFRTAPGFAGHIGIKVPVKGRFQLACELTFQKVKLSIDQCKIHTAIRDGENVLDQIDLDPDKPGSQNALSFGENKGMMSQNWQLPGSNVGFRAGLLINIF
ncbi:hypothetical protein JW835_03795 [bacterium]|nr:hypothetical protein [bacterium]RQV97919.1 MAG: hypothetical protein EH221_02895 [bacterium]